MQRMNQTIKWTILCLMMASGLTSCKMKSGKSVRVIQANNYGILPDTRQNLTAAVNHLIEGLDDEATEIIFQKGRYDFYPDSNYLRLYFETNTYDVNPK